MRGYVAWNGIIVTPNASGSSRDAMFEAPAADLPSSRPTHPHADYWTYGDLRFYEHCELVRNRAGISDQKGVRTRLKAVNSTGA